MECIEDLLTRLQQGEQGARDRLFALAYDELRHLARSRLREGGRNTVLDTTVLVHESYLRFLTAAPLRTQDRRAFFAYAGKVMRSVIIDAVRERQAARRGGGQVELTLDSRFVAHAPSGEDEIVRVHEALAELEKVEPRIARVIEMRYFGGYSEADIADALGMTERTVRRDWEKGRLILLGSLSHPG